MKVIYPYNSGSESARLLAQALGIRRLRRVGSRWRGTFRDWVINWGSQHVPNTGARVINDPIRVGHASNKSRAFDILRAARVRVPDYTFNQATAQQWSNDGNIVVARALVSSSEGRGISIIQPRGRVPHVPLYTKYIKKRHEYRVHVMRGEVIDYAEKLHRRGADHSYVRNTANGYIFARSGVATPHPDVHAQALSAVRALGLDFGAVDVVFNERRSEAYVLEVNTAPGIEGTTLRNYVNAFNRIFR